MSKEQIKDLKNILQPYPTKTRDHVFCLREFVWDSYPNTNELIYDNYNAVAFGWSPTDRLSHTFCSIAAFRTNHHVHFGFYWGNEISDHLKKLLGKGRQYRYILVMDKSDFPKPYISKLLKEAYANSLAKVRDANQIKFGQTITKSVSSKKRM
jgi:hypothetical protein